MDQNHITSFRPVRPDSTVTSNAPIAHEEFHQVIPGNWNAAHLNPQLQRWEHSYNTVRPHRALGYLNALRIPRAS